MQRVVPVLAVTDFARAQRFYSEALAFETDWIWQPDPAGPAFAQLSRGGLSIYLSQNPTQGSPGASCVYLYVDDVDAVHASLTDAGVPPEEAPANRAWGNREFTLLDPDGNLLTLATPRAPESRDATS